MQRFDIVVYGATGFTGRRTLRVLRSRAPGLRIAAAGRNADKLAALGGDFIVADSTDTASVLAMAQQARVLVSTAGPFGRYGDPVVDACVEAGTHYCDITGETPWVRGVIDRLHDKARDAGVRIVPFCGFDSVPSELCALLAVQAWGGVPCTAFMKVGGGGINGGSVASALNLAVAYPRKMMANPFLLNPDPKISRELWAKHADVTRPVQAGGLHGSPWVMGSVNTRVVRRSAAMLEYGDRFSYTELREHKTKGAAWRWTLGLGAVVALLGRGWGRSLIRRFGPQPGDGPSEEDIQRGFARMKLVTDQGTVTWTAQGDAGNAITCDILAECALMLTGELNTPCGVVTPAVAFGRALVERLKDRGQTFEIR